MLTKEEATATIQFLDRVAITGHGERQAMNQIITKLAEMTKDKPPEALVSKDGKSK